MSSLANLTRAGEGIVCRARPHSIVFGPAVLIRAVGAALALPLQIAVLHDGATRSSLAGVGLAPALAAWLRNAGSGFTARMLRVFVRMRLERSLSLESLLSKIEAMEVNRDACPPRGEGGLARARICRLCDRDVELA